MSINPTEQFTEALRCGYKPDTGDIINMLLELQSSFADSEVMTWMNNSPELLSYAFAEAQQCVEQNGGENHE